MKKIMVLLAIAIVLFTACEPTAGGGGGGILPEEEFTNLLFEDIGLNERKYVSHEITVENGVAYEDLWYVHVTFSNREAGEWTERTLFQISTATDRTGEFNIIILKEKEQVLSLGEKYWNTYVILPKFGSEYKSLVDFDRKHYYSYSTEANEYGRQFFRITDTFSNSEFTKLKNADEISVAVAYTDDAGDMTNEGSLDLPIEFIDAISTYF